MLLEQNVDLLEHINMHIRTYVHTHHQRIITWDEIRCTYRCSCEWREREGKTSRSCTVLEEICTLIGTVHTYVGRVGGYYTWSSCGNISSSAAHQTNTTWMTCRANSWIRGGWHKTLAGTRFFFLIFWQNFLRSQYYFNWRILLWKCLWCWEFRPLKSAKLIQNERHSVLTKVTCN